MYNIEVIKHIVCYEQRDFITQLVNTVKVLEEDNLEVDIKYATENGVYTALMIGRRKVEVKVEQPKVDEVKEIKKPKPKPKA